MIHLSENNITYAIDYDQFLKILTIVAKENNFNYEWKSTFCTTIKSISTDANINMSLANIYQMLKDYAYNKLTESSIFFPKESNVDLPLVITLWTPMPSDTDLVDIKNLELNPISMSDKERYEHIINYKNNQINTLEIKINELTNDNASMQNQINVLSEHVYSRMQKITDNHRTSIVQLLDDTSTFNNDVCSLIQQITDNETNLYNWNEKIEIELRKLTCEVDRIKSICSTRTDEELTWAKCTI